MLRKLMLVLGGTMLALTIALPASASHATPAKPPHPNAPTPHSLCLKAIAQANKTFNAQQRAATKALHVTQRAERKALRDAQKAARKALHDQQKAARATFHAQQEAARKACPPKP